jgi:hypothetical protein
MPTRAIAASQRQPLIRSILQDNGDSFVGSTQITRCHPNLTGLGSARTSQIPGGRVEDERQGGRAVPVRY